MDNLAPFPTARAKIRAARLRREIAAKLRAALRQVVESRLLSAGLQVEPPFIDGLRSADCVLVRLAVVADEEASAVEGGNP